jgi:hypothetical protein
MAVFFYLRLAKSFAFLGALVVKTYVLIFVWVLKQ